MGYNAYIFSPFCGLTLTCNRWGNAVEKSSCRHWLWAGSASVGQTLCNMGYDVGGGSNGERAQEMVEVLTHAVEADATEENVLRSLGIRNFDVVVVPSAHLQASILVTLFGRNWG